MMTSIGVPSQSDAGVAIDVERKAIGLHSEILYATRIPPALRWEVGYRPTQLSDTFQTRFRHVLDTFQTRFGHETCPKRAQ